MHISNSSTENFTPKINEIVRPHIRKARIVGEGFIDKSKLQISNIFRKFGIQ